MSVVLDTSSLIAIERGEAKALKWLEKHLEERLMINSITLTEFMVGAHRSEKTDAVKQAKRFLSNFEWISVNPNTAIIAARMRAQELKKGKVTDMADVLIAASAVEHNASLLTSNPKHFKHEELRGNLLTVT